MQNQALTATLCRDRLGRPLATVQGLPGDDFDASPDRLRELAAVLLRIASDAEAEAAKPAPRRSAKPAQRRSYSTGGAA